MKDSESLSQPSPFARPNHLVHLNSGPRFLLFLALRSRVTTEGETQQMKKTILMFAMFVMAFIAEGTVRAWADNPMPVPIPKLAALARATDNPMPVPIPKASGLAL